MPGLAQIVQLSSSSSASSSSSSSWKVSQGTYKRKHKHALRKPSLQPRSLSIQLVLLIQTRMQSPSQLCHAAMPRGCAKRTWLGPARLAILAAPMLICALRKCVAKLCMEHLQKQATQAFSKRYFPSSQPYRLQTKQQLLFCNRLTAGKVPMIKSTMFLMMPNLTLEERTQLLLTAGLARLASKQHVIPCEANLLRKAASGVGLNSQKRMGPWILGMLA